jgi:hypothetical protein
VRLLVSSVVAAALAAAAAGRGGKPANGLAAYLERVDAEQTRYEQAGFARRDAAFLVGTVDVTQPLADRAHALRARWREAAVRAARSADVDFPPRLRHVGT